MGYTVSALSSPTSTRASSPLFAGRCRASPTSAAGSISRGTSSPGSQKATRRWWQPPFAPSCLRDENEISEQYDKVADMLRARFPKAAELMDGAKEELLAFTPLSERSAQGFHASSPKGSSGSHTGCTLFRARNSVRYYQGHDYAERPAKALVLRPKLASGTRHSYRLSRKPSSLSGGR